MDNLWNGNPDSKRMIRRLVQVVVHLHKRVQELERKQNQPGVENSLISEPSPVEDSTPSPSSSSEVTSKIPGASNFRAQMQTFDDETVYLIPPSFFKEASETMKTEVRDLKGLWNYKPPEVNLSKIKKLTGMLYSAASRYKDGDLDGFIRILSCMLAVSAAAFGYVGALGINNSMSFFVELAASADPRTASQKAVAKVH